MPGPVSDAYHPEFSTDANAEDVRQGIRDARRKITEALGPELKNILSVAQDREELRAHVPIDFSEKDLRCIRFALDRATETI